jgi:hypothetical protein
MGFFLLLVVPYALCRGKVMLSKSGVQQGDPIGPLLFAIALFLDLNQHCPDLVLHSWYLDNGTAIDPTDTLVTFVDRLIQNSFSYGLSLNLSKCEIFWPFGRDKWEAFPADMCRIEAAGVELLGGPISTSPSFCNEFTMNRVDKIEALLKELVDLQDPHLQLVLLRSCAGFPRFNFALQTSLPNRITQAIVA